MWFGYPTGPTFEEARTSHETNVQEPPYPVAWSQDNSQIYICGFPHGTENTHVNDTIKDYRRHGERVVSTLRQLRALGVDNLAMEGATDEFIEDFRRGRSQQEIVVYSIKDGSESEGNAGVYSRIIFDYLSSSDWNLFGYEDTELRQEMDRINEGLNGIHRKWKSKLVSDLNRLKEKGLNEGLPRDQIIKMFEGLANDYSSKMSEEKSLYLMERGGPDILYQLLLSRREDCGDRKILPLVRSGKMVAILIGSGHAPNLHERYKEIPHTIFTVDGEMPEVVNPDKLFDGYIRDYFKLRF